MDATFIQNTYTLYSAYEDGRISDLYSLFQSGYNVLYSLTKQCPIQDLVYDMAIYCVNNDCNTTTMLSNALSQLFTITGAINSVGATFYGTLPAISNTTAYFNLYQNLGYNLGMILTIVTGYKPSTILYSSNPSVLSKFESEY
jgi:hypothetical protein